MMAVQSVCALTSSQLSLDSSLLLQVRRCPGVW